MRKPYIVAIAILLLLCLPVTNVYALEEPDLSRSGSISITMTYQEEVVPGGSLTLYRVADVHLENDADFSFRLTEEYSGCDVTLDRLLNSAAAEKLAEFTVTHEIAGEKVQIDEEGNVAFRNLQLGLYLLMQEEPAEGYEPVSPFLVSVPGKKDGSYIYDVDGSPKLALEQAPTEPTQPPTEPDLPPELPETGMNQWPIPVLAVGGLLLMAMGGVLISLGRKRKHED